MYSGHNIISIVDELSNNVSNKQLRKKLEVELGQFSFFLEDNEDFQTLAGVFQIQLQGLEEDNFFANDDSNDEEQLLKPSQLSDTTPTKMHFKKISPLLKDTQRIRCSACTTTLGSVRAYKAHIKKMHSALNITPDPSLTDPRATCYCLGKNLDVCEAKLPLAYMYEHLKSQHNEVRPSNKHHLRGFDLIAHKPIFLFKSDNDPDNELQNLKEEAQQIKEIMNASDKKNTSKSIRTSAEDKDQAIMDIDDEPSTSSSSQVNQKQLKIKTSNNLKIIASPSCSRLLEIDKTSPGPSKTSIEQTRFSPSASPVTNILNISPENSKNISLLSPSGTPENEEIPKRLIFSDNISTSSGESSNSQKSLVASVSQSTPNQDTQDDKKQQASLDALTLSSEPNNKMQYGEKSKRKKLLFPPDLSPATKSASKKRMKIGSASPIFAKKVKSEQSLPKSNVRLKSPHETPIQSSSKNLFTKRKLVYDEKDNDSQYDSMEEDMIKKAEKENDSEDDSLEEELSLMPSQITIEDSDYEENDSENFSIIRIENKRIRHELRSSPSPDDLHLKDENSNFIEDMKSYLVSQLSTLSKNQKPIQKKLDHLFYQKDSLLQFRVKQDMTFCLENLVDFEGPNYKSLKYPGDWIHETHDADTTKSTERLKAHASLRLYLQHKASKLENIAKRNEVFGGCKTIEELIAKEKLFKKYELIYNFKKIRLDNAKLAVNASKQHLIQNVLILWNQTECKKQLQEEYEEMYNTARIAGEIRGSKFTKWSHWCRFNMMLVDKGRAGVYNFRNEDWYSRQAMYFPEGYDDFNKLPAGYNPFIKPTEDAEPTNYAIRLSGDLPGIKLHEAQSIIITTEIADLCVGYILLKEMVIPKEVIDDKDPFFVNHRNKQLTRLQNSKNSLLNKMGDAVGIPELSVNTIRKSSETFIQGNEEMTARVKMLNKHSAAVGLKNYAQNEASFKAQYIRICDKREKGEDSEQNLTINEERAAKRKEMDKSDSEKSYESHVKYIKIQRAKALENRPCGKRVRVKANHREFLMQLVFTEIFDKKVQVFPAG